jgi:molecular chaperone GrpE
MPDETPAPEPETAPASPEAAPTLPSEPKEDWETRFKYLLADFENFRRRSAKERETVTQQARAAMLRELLPLVDAFRAATGSVGHLAPSDPLRRGFELLDREWAKFLKHEGVEPVVEVGRPFRAEEAEAVGEVATGPTSLHGTVHEVVQQGYRFFGGLLRPAKVIVARAAATARPAPPEVAPGGTPPEAES